MLVNAKPDIMTLTIGCDRGAGIRKGQHTALPAKVRRQCLVTLGLPEKDMLTPGSCTTLWCTI